MNCLLLENKDIKSFLFLLLLPPLIHASFHSLSLKFKMLLRAKHTNNENTSSMN